jgi:hypothetical protein
MYTFGYITWERHKKKCIIIQIKSDLLELFYLAFYIARYRWILWDLYFYFISWMTVIINMKPARPWILAHLKIIWQFHAHPVHQKVSRFCGPRYIGDDFFLGPNLVSFNRVVVPYEISKVNFRVETKILVSVSEEI